jgi:hypothetical protein
MRYLFVLMLTACFYITGKAQLKAKADCNNFLLTVDLLDGKVNGMRPNIPLPELKQKLSCSTGIEEEGTAAKCGAGVFYKDRDLYFYTDRDYVEIGEKFKGKLSIQLIGKPRNTLFNLLGNPSIKDVSWDAYQMSYGIMVVHFNKTGKINKIQFSTRSADQLNLCE